MNALPTLFASAETVRAVSEARAAVALVGSYDGSGNFGDIAQFDAATDLAGRLGREVLTLPVLEREYLESHRDLLAGSGLGSPPALFFDPTGGAGDDDLLPVVAPAELAFAGLYLYGGGYLNPAWGERKLAMLRSAEALLGAGDPTRTTRVASGLQVDPSWTSALGERDAAMLRSFGLLGARDPISVAALAALGNEAPVFATGDDAVGLLPAGPPAGAAVPGDALHVNLHFAEHDWVVGQRPAVLDFYAGILAELGRLAGRRVVAQPLVAYLDRRVDEGPGIARLRAACSAPATELLEPLVLRPSELGALTPRLGTATLTLSCSYHVALASLLLGVPAVLLADNPYYEQKATGLAADFGLPAAFAPASGADPVSCASEIFDAALAPGRGEALRLGVAAGTERARARRARAATAVLSHLAAESAAALTTRVGELGERLRQRSTEPAELEARLAALGTELDELRREAAHTPLDAELRAQDAEAELATVLNSRSWRLTAALRRLGRLGRRR